MIRADAVRPQEILALALLALGTAFGITLAQPVLALKVAVGFLILLIAFVSTRAALYLLIFAMLLSPEVPFGQVQGRGVGGRELSIRMDDVLLLIIGLGWLVKTIVFRELALIKYTPVNRAILYYMVVCVVATMLGVLTGRVRVSSGFFFVLKYFEYFFIFYMVVNNVTTRDQMNHLLIALLATCTLISLYAIFQIPSGQRATAPFEGEAGEPNTLGGYLVFIMAITVGLILNLQNPRLRVALLALMGLCGLALMATLSRSSYLAAAVMALAVTASQWRRPALVAVLLIGLAMIPVIAPANVKERVSYTFYGQKYGGEVRIGRVSVDSSTSERLRSWMTVVENWTHRPLLGYGVTGYAWADAQYVKILGETGLAGIIAFGFLIYRLWACTWRAWRTTQDPVAKGLAQGFLFGIIAMLVHGVGANTFIIIRIMEPFWLCAGLVMLLPALEEERSLSARQGAPA